MRLSEMFPSKEPVRPDTRRRAELYISKACPAGQGQRNTTLHELAFNLLRNFDLTEQEHHDLCTDWALQCDPPMHLTEASKTIRSAWQGAQRKGVQPIEASQSRITKPNTKSTDAAEPRPSRYASQAVLERLEDKITGKYINQPWPWPALTKLAKALLPGTMTLLCAPPGVGKSLFLLEAVCYWALNGVHTAIMELEEDQTFHMERAWAQLAHNADLLDDNWLAQHPDDARQSLEEYTQFIDEIGRCVWERPDCNDQQVYVDWVAARVAEGTRIILIDPITARDTGKEVWVTDHQLVDSLKRVVEGSQASLILATHPNGRRLTAAELAENPMEDFGGGKAWTQFSQCCLYLRMLESKERDLAVSAGNIKAMTNRQIEIRKARSASGPGMAIGCWFDRKTLKLHEKGLVTS